MGTELTAQSSTAIARPNSEVAVVANERYPLASAAHPQMEKVMRMPTFSEMAEELHRDGVARDVSFQPENYAGNVLALANYMQVFFPTETLVRLALLLLGAIHAFFKAKQFGDEAYRRYTFMTMMLRKNKHLHALPPCIKTVLGGVFVLCGASGTGKSSFIRQFMARLPGPFQLDASSMAAMPGLSGVFVFPCVRLDYPKCGSAKGLVRAMREYFSAHIDSIRLVEDKHSDAVSLPDMLASDPVNAAITACISLNVGMLIVDGAGIQNSNYRSTEVLSVLTQIHEQSGMPVMLSCTAAFLKSIEHNETLYANLTNHKTVNLELLETPQPPPQPDSQGVVDPDYDVTRHMCKTWWCSGLLPKDTPMPTGLEYLVEKIAMGNQRFYAQAFAAIHEELLDNVTNDEADPNRHVFNTAFLTDEENTRGFIEAAMFASAGARAALQSALDLAHERIKAVPESVINFVDYFPMSLIQIPAIAAWVTPAVDKRRGRLK
ncbi:hypothetical protein EJD96_21965 [Herbaspirillum seropedicae]|uniref:hypothetical protein n=1 Tax=Herbaspirillum seropedicae TaxID=964 RepID=UPI00112067C7|nr:hypothetical protein [Herbaspirillum seropedicae]QDD66640.1 hypothetical protein EJD96_21965 [Herbaspirillum seropedicae]